MTLADVKSGSADDAKSVASGDGDSSRFSLRAIQNMTLKNYSGETDKYADWYKSTEQHFGKAGAKPLLTDVRLCNEFLSHSYAAKCIVANSLKDGSAAYLNHCYKDEESLATFMIHLDKNFNQKVDEKTREFNRWKTLFTLTLEKSEDADTFINDFELCTSKLREHKSKGVEDECLMRAILLHAVWADNFHHCKLQLMNDYTKKVDNILQEVKTHFMTAKSNTELVGTKPNSKSVRFAGKLARKKSDEMASHCV